jgi:hypothetical protein
LEELSLSWRTLFRDHSQLAAATRLTRLYLCRHGFSGHPGGEFEVIHNPAVGLFDGDDGDPWGLLEQLAVVDGAPAEGVAAAPQAAPAPAPAPAAGQHGALGEPPQQLAAGLEDGQQEQQQQQQEQAPLPAQQGQQQQAQQQHDQNEGGGQPGPELAAAAFGPGGVVPAGAAAGEHPELQALMGELQQGLGALEQHMGAAEADGTGAVHDGPALLGWDQSGPKMQVGTRVSRT